MNIRINHLCVQVMWKLFAPKSRTRLGRLCHARSHADIMDLVDAYSLEENEYYFDRDPTTFNCVLNYYRVGKLHIIDEICPLDFADDLKFWMIDDSFLEFCCQGKFHDRKDFIHAELAKQRNATEDKEEETTEDFGVGFFVPYQRALWDLFEKPQSSPTAKIMSLVSVSVVLTSLCGMCFNTFPWTKVEDINGELADNPKLGLVEALCISFFTVEFLLRFASSPNKIEFLKVKMNIIDVLAIAPYYLTLAFLPQTEFGPTDCSKMANNNNTTLTTVDEEESPFGNIGRIMQVFRIARIMRIFKLARRNVGLQSIAYTVSTSYKDLGLLFSLVFMGMLVFGSLQYFIEGEEQDTGFYSIPQGMWWAQQTLTSVGYGDFTPVTTTGKGCNQC